VPTQRYFFFDFPIDNFAYNLSLVVSSSNLSQVFSSLVIGPRCPSASTVPKEQVVDAALASARECLDGKDFPCAIHNANAVLELDVANAQAIEIKQAAALAQEQSKDLTQKINRLMGDATTCMDKKNYSCAIAKAESVLELDAGYKPASTLKNRALETQRKLKETGFTIR